MATFSKHEYCDTIDLTTVDDLRRTPCMDPRNQASNLNILPRNLECHS